MSPHQCDKKEIPKIIGFSLANLAVRHRKHDFRSLDNLVVYRVPNIPRNKQVGTIQIVHTRDSLSVSAQSFSFFNFVCELFSFAKTQGPRCT